MNRQKTDTTQYAQPLVSFILLGYNQEKFIREAISAAFSQIYSPLEIILSDDCSLVDDTFEIMKEMAERVAVATPKDIVIVKSEGSIERTNETKKTHHSVLGFCETKPPKT